MFGYSRGWQAHAIPGIAVLPHEGYVLGIFRGDLRHPGHGEMIEARQPGDYTPEN